MSVDEDVSRYQKILEDWRPGPSGPRPAQRLNTPRSSPPSQVQPARRPTAIVNPPVAPHGLTSPGAILLVNERTLAIYLKPVPEKEYHLLQVLCPNGAIKTQGLALQAHQFEEVGSLPSPYFDDLQRASTWDRDLIVFHCYRYEDAARIPRPLESDRPTPTAAATGNAPAATPATAPADGGELRRGQKLQIKFGNNTWDAVYWGRDTQDHVVAHKTYQKWALMHLDLDRFAHTMNADLAIDDSLIQEIENDLLGAQ